MILMSLFSIADIICGRNNPFCTSSKGAAGDFDEKEQKKVGGGEPTLIQ